MIPPSERQIELAKKFNRQIGPKPDVDVENLTKELNNVRTNLNVASKETLLLLVATIKSMENGLKDLFPEEKLTISGYYSTEWLSDLTSKFNSLNLSLEKERLKKLEEKLHSLLSTDTKVELEIADLKGQI
mgnify:CR=1 FL=1